MLSLLARQREQLEYSDVAIENVIKALIPFYIVLVGTVLIISYIPEIALYIPRILGYVD